MPETPADLGDRLRAGYGDVREAAPIDVPNHRFTARVFTIPAVGTPGP